MNGFFTSICAVAIATALFRIAAPENAFKKQIALLISCFFMLGLISCFTNGGVKIDTEAFESLEMQSYVDFSGKVNAKAQKQIATELSNKISDILAAEKIFPEQIHVIINIRGTYSIDISEVKLVFKKESGADTVLAQTLVSDAVEGTIPITIITE